MSDAMGTATIEAFLLTFFGGDNRLTLDRVDAPHEERTRLVRPWVERLRQTPPLPTVLPRVQADKSVVWYALAFSSTQLRALADDLLAFVGPTWSTFRGHLSPLASDDPIDRAVTLLTDGAAFTFVSPATPDAVDSPGSAKAALEALDRMRRVWAQRPERAPELPRATGRVLRDFHLALQSGDRRAAEAELHYLRDHHRLDALNLLFLRIRLLADLGSWSELEALPALPSVLQVRRPLAVTEALVRAVYHARLDTFESTDDPDGAVARFRTEILPAFGDLFVSHAGMGAPEVAKSFMLAAAAASPPRVETCHALLARDDLAQADRRWLVRVASLVVPVAVPAASPPPIDPLTAAAIATLELDFVRAFDLAAGAPASCARVKLLFECAYNLQTLEAERVALRALDDLTSPERDAFLKVRANASYWESLTGRTVSSVPPPPERAAPADWFDWFARLQEDPTWSRAVAVAEQGALEWGIDPFLARANSADELLARIADLQNTSALQDAIPHLLGFFQRDLAWPRESLRNLYRGLLEFVVYSSSGGVSTLGRVRDLAEALLAVGGGAAEYRALVRLCGDVWAEHASPVCLEWALDVVDMFVSYPCPHPDARVQLLVDIVGRIAQFYRKVEPEHWRFLRLLCDELGQVELLASFAPPTSSTAPTLAEDPLWKLRHKSVTIYTLTEEAGKRAKEVLERRCNGVSVRLSADHGGNDRLRDLARHTDVFVMVTASAKHAATMFIEAHRPKDRPLLRPDGKGSASILRALVDYLSAGDGQS